MPITKGPPLPATLCGPDRTPSAQAPEKPSLAASAARPPGLHFSPFQRAPEASPKVEAPEGPPLAALAIRPPDPRRTGSVVRRTCPVEDVNTSQVHMRRLPRDLHVHASRGDVLARRSKVCACAKQWAAGAETTIIPGGCTVRATCALPCGRNLRAGPESAQSTETVLTSAALIL